MKRLSFAEFTTYISNHAPKSFGFSTDDQGAEWSDFPSISEKFGEYSIFHRPDAIVFRNPYGHIAVDNIEHIEINEQTAPAGCTFTVFYSDGVVNTDIHSVKMYADFV